MNEPVRAGAVCGAAACVFNGFARGGYDRARCAERSHHAGVFRGDVFQYVNGCMANRVSRSIVVRVGIGFAFTYEV
jgi:hypothetical protein